MFVDTILVVATILQIEKCKLAIVIYYLTYYIMLTIKTPQIVRITLPKA